jgi:hypothetical protein
MWYAGKLRTIASVEHENRAEMRHFDSLSSKRRTQINYSNLPPRICVPNRANVILGRK